MRAVVPYQLERLAAAALGHDLQLRRATAVRQRPRQVPQLAIDFDRERGSCEAGTDSGRRVGAGRALAEAQLIAIWELKLHQRRMLTVVAGPAGATLHFPSPG